MAEEALIDDAAIFVYMGGDQQVPRHIRRAKIHKSVKIVRANAFHDCTQLLYVEFHDGVEIIEVNAFNSCRSLRSIKVLGVKIIKGRAFQDCYRLTDIEFGNKLETIEHIAFCHCNALTKIKMPCVSTLGKGAFVACYNLSEVEIGEGLRALQARAFRDCPNLKRIVLPLKDVIIEDDVFLQCPKLSTVDLIEGIHNTVSSLHMESWRSEMNDEINSINQILRTTTRKTLVIQQWMRSAFRQLNHCKEEHRKIVKEAITLLELALWKANLSDNDWDWLKTTRGSRKRARKEIFVTSGADVVIKNVLPFLAMK